MADFIALTDSTPLKDIEKLDKFTNLAKIVRIFAKHIERDGTDYYKEIMREVRRLRDREGVDLRAVTGIREDHRPGKRYATWTANIKDTVAWLKAYEKRKPCLDFEILEIPYGLSKDALLKKNKGVYNMIAVLNLIAPPPHPLNYINLRRNVKRIADAGGDPKADIGAWFEESHGYLVDMARFGEWFLEHEPG